MPDIHLVSPGGKASKLADHLAPGGAVVFFMRAHNCPMCLAHSAAAVRMAAAGELGSAALIIIAPGDAADAAAVQKRLASPHATVFASGSAHQNAGLGSTMLIQHSGTFVLDANGTVLSARTSTLPMGSFSRAEVLETLGSRVG